MGFLWGILIVLFLNWLIFPNLTNRKINVTDYGTFIGKMEEGKIKEVMIKNNQIYFTVAEDGDRTQTYQTGEINDPQLVDRLLEAESPNPTGKIAFNQIVPEENSPILNFILMWILPGLIFYLIWKQATNSIRARMGSNGGNFMSFGSSGAKIYADSDVKTTFADVAGQNEAKETLTEIVDFLHNPQKYTDIGASLPKGALLVGPPGTGKTLVARATAGSSGAELANIVNEAALRAVRMKQNKVTTNDLEESVETVIAGAQKKGKVISTDEKRIIAYHEIGHAMVAAMQTHSAPVHKITIIPRTSGALGYTMQVDSGEQVLLSKEDLFNRIVTYTGGRAAEEFICNTVTTGTSNDIEQATKLARAMVTRYGMSETYDMMGLETVKNAYLGGDTSLTCSTDTATDIDHEVLRLIKEAHQKARKIITENLEAMHQAATFLIEKETITGDEFMRILQQTEKQ